MSNYHITTFGCAMNTSDSERVAAVCEMMDYKRTEDINDASLIIINSCSIRQKAEDRVMGMGKKINQIKQNNSNAIAILTGCMAQRDLRQPVLEKNIEHQNGYSEKLLKTLPWLNHVVEINDIHNLPKYLRRDVKIDVSEYLSVTPKYSSKSHSYLPISTGCNKFCTFCIVPFTRGKEVYRPFKEIESEFKVMVENGFREITLLGQNVNSWRDTDDSYKPKKGEKDFAFLLEEIGEIIGNHWVRFTSSHPYDINMRLAEVVNTYPTLAKQFHFALQSGDNAVLKRMNRHYTVEDFIEKVEQIRNTISRVAVTTDIIVGFPGETEEEFQNTAKVLKKLKFDQVFISEFSNRKGTLADKFYKDDIPNDIKSNRKEILNEIVAKGNFFRNQEMIGSLERILIYKENKKGLIGRTSNGKDVEILNSDGNIQMGEFYNAEILEVTNWSLKGKVINFTHNI